MFSIAIIVFREVLEIALILGVLLAATKGLRNRAWWVWLGVFLGIGGAVVVACFADAISQAAQGMGQEMMNATILFIAAVLIGWTVIWINRNGKELAQHFKELGTAVIKGQKPKYMITGIVALSVLREGSEIVMFIYGAFVSGGKIHLLMIGSLLGACMGIMAGAGIYYGLMIIPIKKTLVVTSWLLILLVAGMVAGAFGYLAAAGRVPDLIPMVWDTSRVISDGSFLGEIMHILIGYTDRPSGIQLLVYLLTVGVLFTALKIFGQASIPNTKKYLTLLMMGLIGTFGLSHSAFAEKRVFEPYAEQGELEVETTGVYDFDHARNKNAVQEYHNAVGYGVTSIWHTELEIETETQPTVDAITPLKATHMEWENIFQLTQQGEYWVDAGVYFAYEAPLINKQVGQFEGKILLEKSIDKITNTLNINFNKEVGGGRDPHTDGGISWSAKYRLSQYFEPGAEYYNDFSALAHQLNYDQQSHQVGPAFYGHLFNHVKYDIGYLFGVSKTAPIGELKWVLEYEF
ncbi:MAG: FTR1 family protein [Candidatus Omnitrophica bacterium]|nr:FTR1 family protein [Candidatus Omnitrophota bacterium]